VLPASVKGVLESCVIVSTRSRCASLHDEVASSSQTSLTAAYRKAAAWDASTICLPR
jgi:hypothetical protein